MITAYRLTKQKHQDTAMDGEGAKRYGGRWNSKGNAVIYTSSSRALAMLEILVHLEDETVLSEAYIAFDILIPDELVLYLESELPEGWRDNPPNSVSRAIGDEWIRNQSSLALAVPSTIVPPEYNYLINPDHPDFQQLEIQGPHSINFDPRLI